MPISQIKPTPSLRKEDGSLSGVSNNFAGKDVRRNDSPESLSETPPRSDFADSRSIRDRSASPPVGDTPSVYSDALSETQSFHSAIEDLEDSMPADDVSFGDVVDDETSQTSSIDYHKVVAENQETIKDLEDADPTRLSDYIKDFTEVYTETGGANGIALDLKQPLQALVDYGEKLDTDMQRLETLGQKLQDQGLSEQESLEMKALMHCNKYNLSSAQGWISATLASRLKAGTMNEPTAILLTTLSNRLAMRHMNLADTTSLYEDRLPSGEPLSRGDRIEYNLLTARAGLSAFTRMMRPLIGTHSRTSEKMQRIRRSLEAHCAELEHVAQVAKGQVKMDVDAPRLKLASLDAWTEDFDLAEDKKQISLMRLPQQAAEQLSSQWNKTPPVLVLSHRHLSQRDMMRLFIEFQLERNDIDAAQLPKFEANYKQALIDEINQGEWPIIDKSLHFNIGDKSHTCRSVITPGGYLANRSGKPYENRGVTCADRLQIDHAPNMAHTRLVAEDGETLFSGVRHGILDAYSYHDKKLSDLSDAKLTQMARAIYDDEQSRLRGRDTSTLAQQLQALEETEDDGESITVFDPRKDSLDNAVDEPVVISKKSVNMRYLEKQIKLRNEHVKEIVDQIKTNPRQRKHYINEIRNLASRKMAQEVLSAAIVSDPAKLAAALNGETIDVTMNSVGLVTPDWLRHVTSNPKDERRMLEHQMQGLQSLARGHSPDNPVRLKIKDDSGQLKEIKVNVKVRTFNFGVNEYALARTVLPANFPIWRNLMGWGFSAGLNDPQLSELLGARNDVALGGAVADKLQELEQSGDPKVQKRAMLLREAATQVKEIWKNRSFRSGNNEPYKMVSRLALTSHLMGETPLFNCKSGKDRTGQLDAEVKYLAAVGHATGHIPEPDIEHTAESRKMRTTFTLDAGNLEMQRLNTGLPGYKLRNVPGLKAMLEAGTQVQYEGGSDFISS